jgi:hypothetical protein
MRNTVVCLIACLCIIHVTSTASWAQHGPTQASNVFTLPNEAVTPNWKSNRPYVPKNCRRNPDACADDHRFWEG